MLTLYFAPGYISQIPVTIRGFVLKAILSDSQFLVPAVVFVGGIILLAILR